METVRAFAEHLLPPLLVILAGVLTVLGHAAIRWLSRRLDVEDLVRGAELERRWTEVVDLGTAYAEKEGMRWAQGHGALPEPAQKLDWAIEWAAREAKRRGLPERARNEIVDLIEARLGHDDAPGDTVRARDAYLDLLQPKAAE